MTKPEIAVLSDPAALAHEAARRFVAIARSAIAARGQFYVALSGGSTPRAMNALLSSEADPALDWTRVQVFWGDERCVPPDHPDSNYGMARQTLLSKVDVPDQNVHRMHGELDPAQAALEYETELKRTFRVDHPQLPYFDLILLGMGPDGHTASLFPGTAAIHEHRRWVVAHHVEKLHADRITLTPPVLNSAAHILFLVSGPEKAGALQSVLEGARQVDRYPAQIVLPVDGQTTWLVDQAAAANLSP